MAHGIPHEIVERVRTQADIVEIVSEYLTLKRAGANLKACCPFHKEKTPSFMVSPSKQIYHCFGCGAGGDVFGFLMQQEGLTFSEAVKRVAARLGITIKEVHTAPGEQQLREQLEKLYDFTARYFHRNLLKSPEAAHAREYLEGRNIPIEAIEQFSIGYAPSRWDALISDAGKKGFSKELLLQGGLAKESPEGRIYDAFRNRVMFPIWDTWGVVIAFGGRTLVEGQPKYINSPETPIYKKGQTLYNLHRAKKSVSNENSVIVVEGYTDLTRLVMSGIENVVASLGTALTKAQARLIKRYASEVIFVLDSDEAGETAKKLGTAVLFSEDLVVKLARVPPPAKDPDEFVQKHGVQAFSEVVANAEDCVEYLTGMSLAEFKDPKNREEKVKAAETLLSLVGNIPNPIRRDEYLRLIASRIDVKPETLLEVSRKKGPTGIIEEEVRDYENQLMHEEKKCMWMLKLLMQRPQDIGKVRENLDVASIKNEGLQQLFTAIFDTEEICVNEEILFTKAQSVEAQKILSKLTFEKAGPEVLYPVEWWISFMKCHQTKEKLVSLLKEITEAERSGDKERYLQLAKQKMETRRALEMGKRERAAIPVFVTVERGDHKFASLVSKIASRELEKAERAGDLGLVEEWKGLGKKTKKEDPNQRMRRMEKEEP